MTASVIVLTAALVAVCTVLVVVCLRVHERDGRERAMLLNAALSRSPGEFGKLQQQNRPKPSTAEQRWADDLRAHLELVGADGAAGDVPLVPEGL